jgi:hypothetical protein
MLLKLYILVITTLTIPFSAFAEYGDTIVFAKTFGGTENDFGYSIRQTSDSGFVVAGQTDSYGSGSLKKPDIWVLKLDMYGNTVWEKTFGGMEGDGAYDISETYDKGFIVAGLTSSFGKGYPSIFILKLSPEGDTLWTRRYEGSVVSHAHSIRQTADSGFVVAGFGKENIIKLDVNGRKEWGTHYGWIFYSIQQTTDGGYIAAGDTVFRQQEWSYIPSCYIIKLNRQGNMEWRLNPGKNLTGRASSVMQTYDGGFIVAGDSLDLHSSSEQVRYAMVLKLSRDGSPEWKYVGSELTDAMCIQQTSDNSFIFAGNIPDKDNGMDLMVVKLDDSGHEEWVRAYGKMSTWEYASSVEETFDGGYIVAGHTESYGAGRYDMWILKLNHEGNMPGIPSAYYPPAIQPESHLMEQNFPNPFRAFTTINYQLYNRQLTTLKIYNPTGIEIAAPVSEIQSAGNYSVTWNGCSVTPGIYYYRLQTGNYIETRKMVVTK